jgi:multiple sugar transport system permease protein
MAIAFESKVEVHAKARSRTGERFSLIALIVLLILITFVFIFPFAWAVLNSLKTPAELLIVPIQWLPKQAQWSNYTFIFTEMPFARSFGNSLLVSASVTLSVILFGSLAGFALAKYRFPGRSLYMAFILATMTVPSFVFLMPHFFMVYALGWMDTYLALIVPGAITAFGIFFMRQFIYATVPDELMDAGRIDGCSDLRLFYNIVMPLCKSAYLVLGVLTFIANWNEFLWPLIVTQSETMYTIPVLLSTLQQAYGSMKYTPMLMAGTNIAIIPGILLFILVQKQIVQGIAVTGLK